MWLDEVEAHCSYLTSCERYVDLGERTSVRRAVRLRCHSCSYCRMKIKALSNTSALIYTAVWIIEQRKNEGHMPIASSITRQQQTNLHCRFAIIFTFEYTFAIHTLPRIFLKRIRHVFTDLFKRLSKENSVRVINEIIEWHKIVKVNQSY